MEPFITTEVILDSLGQGANLLWSSLALIVMPIIVAELFWKMIKIFLHWLYSFVNIGLTARETKRANKKIDDVVDVVSNAPDLISALKSDKGK